MKWCFAWDGRACFKRLTFLFFSMLSDDVEIVGQGKLAGGSCSALCSCKAIGLCKLKHGRMFWEETKLFTHVWRQNLQQMLFLQLFWTILHTVWCLYLTGINHTVVSFYLTCSKVEGSSWSFLWGILFSPAARVDFCLGHCLHDILLQNEAIWSYLCSTAWENREA